MGLTIIDIDKSSLMDLSNDQWQTLLHMLNDRKNNTTEKMTGKVSDVQCIIDTGASNHMTGCIENMCEIRDGSNCPVGLPDG